SLKWGGGGEGSYSDFNSYLINASVTFDMDAKGSGSPPGGMGGDGVDHAAMGHGGGHMHEGVPEPAGVRFAHALPAEGFMGGARYVNSRNSGSMFNGSNKADDTQMKTAGCNGGPCLIAPNNMNMDMYMLELMYAPTDWLTLMLMPQYMDMSMSSRGLLTDAEQ